jgi:hypothetical protein
MDFSDGGSSRGRTVHGDYKGAVMERIKYKDIPKAKYQVFKAFVKVL